MLQEVFATLGFRDEEVKAYLLLLDHGACPAGDLARLMGAPRPSVYGYLERLMEGGLVSQSMNRGVKVFVPEPGDKIRALYKRKIEELQAKERSLDVILPALQRHAGLTYMRPQMRFFEGRQGIESALEDILTAPAGTMTCSFWPIAAAISVTSSEFFRYHNAERIKRDIHVQGIWPRKQGVEIKKHPFLGSGPDFKREIRQAPSTIETHMGYWIYGHKVIFTSSRTESYAFIMESAEMAQLMTTQHRLIWGMSEPILSDPRDTKSFIEDVRNNF
ncbi:MAG: TrmB family transcriptional regulator [Alphaproteobacteria bacterium]